jgi:hypothetical protein
MNRAGHESRSNISESAGDSKLIHVDRVCQPVGLVAGQGQAPRLQVQVVRASEPHATVALARPAGGSRSRSGCNHLAQ